MPVCPTCSAWGRQPASTTAREAPTAAPSASASSSTSRKFSGSLRPRPPLTITDASATSSLACSGCLTSVVAAADALFPAVGATSSTLAFPVPSTGASTFGRNEMTQRSAVTRAR